MQSTFMSSEADLIKEGELVCVCVCNPMIGKYKSGRLLFWCRRHSTRRTKVEAVRAVTAEAELAAVDFLISETTASRPSVVVGAVRRAVRAEEAAAAGR